MPQIQGRLSRGRNILPQIQGIFMHGGQNHAPDTGQTYARGVETCPRFRADFSGVGMTCPSFRADFSGVGMTYKLILLQPAGEHLTILHVSIDKTGMTGMPEQMPLAVWNIFIERCCHNRRADIARATTDKCRLGNLTQSIRILEVLQAAERLIFIRSPAIEVGFCAGALRTTDAFW